MSLNTFTLFISFFIFSSLTFAQTITEQSVLDREHYQYYFGDFNGGGFDDVMSFAQQSG